MNNQFSVVSGLSEFKEDQLPKKSLLQRIEESSSNNEVLELLKIGSEYKNASHKTLKMWAKAAALRTKQLESR